jgi:RES domain-containing protein
VLQEHRPSARAVAEFVRLFGWAAADRLVLAGVATAEWRRSRLLSEATFDTAAQLSDLREGAQLADLERRHAGLLKAHRMSHLDLTQLTSRNRAVTRAIARDLYERAFGGVIYPSAVSPGGSCIAVFEHLGQLLPANGPEPVCNDIPELIQVCGEWHIVLRPC